VVITRRAALGYGAYLAALAAGAGVAGEFIARRSGHRPWDPRDPGVQVEPGKRFFRPDTVLGYTHLPGEFTVTLGTGYRFRVSHGPDTWRRTRPATAAASGRPPLWIFGCSFTHGWTLEDAATYPWLLQQQFPDLEVVNFGVSGYGTAHALLQFRAALLEMDTGTRPRAVLAYAGFHDARNVFARSRRKEVAPWNRLGDLRQPRARLDDGGRVQLTMAEVDYTPWPLMRESALVHLLESRYDDLEATLLKSHAVSRALVADIAALAAERGVPLLVAGLMGDEATRDMLAYATSLGLPTVDLALPLDEPAWNQMPHDPHPNARANAVWAERLAEKVPDT